MGKNRAKQFISHSNIHIDLSGAENLKGFGDLVIENGHLEVEDSQSGVKSQGKLL